MITSPSRFCRGPTCFAACRARWIVAFDPQILDDPWPAVPRFAVVWAVPPLYTSRWSRHDTLEDAEAAAAAKREKGVDAFVVDLGKPTKRPIELTDDDILRGRKGLPQLSGRRRIRPPPAIDKDGSHCPTTVLPVRSAISKGIWAVTAYASPISFRAIAAAIGCPVAYSI